MGAEPGGSGGDCRGRGAPPGQGERGGPRARPRGSAPREAAPGPAPLCPPAVPRPRPVAALRGPAGAKPSRLESQENPDQEGRGLAAGHSAQPGPSARAREAPLPPLRPPGRPGGPPFLSKRELRPRSQGRASAVAVRASVLDKSLAPSGLLKLPFLAEPSQAPLSGL